MKKYGKDKTYYLYNICDPEECYKEVGSQAVAYTTGVPAMIGAMMVMTPRTKGKTNIGCIFQGKKDGKDKTYYLYNICDHEECYKEVGSQAVAYTTGVPAMIGAMMVMTGKWNKPGVHNIEEFDPDPFMDALNKWGLPWKETHTPVLRIK